MLSTEKKVFHFIEEYWKRPILWDPQNAGYYKKPKKLDAWYEVSQAMGFEDNNIGVAECETKMKSLMTSNRTERGKV